jgi:hypothetical protein
MVKAIRFWKSTQTVFEIHKFIQQGMHLIVHLQSVMEGWKKELEPQRQAADGRSLMI